MKVAIDKEVAQALLKYLARLPYGEVYAFIPVLMQAPVVPMPTDKATEAPPKPEKLEKAPK